ncbi:MAG TPA: CARDB domain-containing protein [Methanothrix sp.]|nr:CARDB domain-containing protein [Methanothrix sp.]
MKVLNRISKIVALLGIFLLAASIADCQMNRESPFLESKLPRTNDQSMIGKGQLSASPIMISEPFNSQAVSDLMIFADQNNTTCNQVSFLLTLTTSPSGTTGYQPVKVRVLENRQGSPTAVAELILLMPATGGSLHETIGFSSASLSAGGSGASEITVTADPDSQIPETNERNNSLTISGTCMG